MRLKITVPDRGELDYAEAASSMSSLPPREAASQPELPPVQNFTRAPTL
jgi:hypothetical protein